MLLPKTKLLSEQAVIALSGGSGLFAVAISIVMIILLWRLKKGRKTSISIGEELVTIIIIASIVNIVYIFRQEVEENANKYFEFQDRGMLREGLGGDAVDQTGEAAGCAVQRLTEEMKLMQRLIPCDSIELRDCIGQGKLNTLLYYK